MLLQHEADANNFRIYEQKYNEIIMKLFAISRTLRTGLLGAAVALGLSASFTSCSEDINEGDYAIAKKQTVTEYLKSQPQFTDICALFERVKLGNSADASVLASVMSARGNYTVFAPNNEAVEAYMRKVGANSLAELSDEDAGIIALNCVIDNGSESAYESADFPTPGTFAYSNLNDRTLTSAMDTIGNDIVYVINGTSQVVKADVELSNGMVHEVSTVISPSADNLGQRIADADNMKIFARLLQETSWADSITGYRDAEYEKQNYQEVTDYRLASEPNHIIRRPIHRYIGYTALVEPDSIYEQKWGISATLDAEGNITNWDQIYPIIKAKCEAHYTNGSDDVKNPDNAVNQFVAYHIMKGSMAYDKFVRHLNEYNYKYGDIKNPQTKNCPTDVWNYYATIGPHSGLIKIVQAGDGGDNGDPDHKIYANRVCTYDTEPDGDYHVKSVDYRGFLISPDNGKNDNNAQNGFYFPIDDILVYNMDMRQKLGGERMRIDICTMLPEMQSNKLRGQDYRLFPLGFFDNIMNESADTKITYICDQGGGEWNDYQGDEMLFCGLFDFTLKLPPVPVDGTYEIRMGVGMNPMRGMAQIYFGSEPYKLSPAGLPYDMRQTVSANNTEIPWVADTDDQTVNAENDKNMRNHGYMKGPQYFTITNGKADTPVRERSGNVACVRRIIVTADMKSGHVYYLRFKSALKKLDSQFFLDYFEIVPTSVYNGVQPEDIW